jgi:hypothetical protein
MNSEDFKNFFRRFFWTVIKNHTFAEDMWCPFGLNRESGENPGQFPLL